MFGDRASFGFSCWSASAGRMSTAHQHNDIEVNFSASDLVYMVGGRRVEVPAGRVSAFWGATPHQLVEVRAESPITWLTVPLARFTSWRVPRATVRALLGGEVLVAPTDWKVADGGRRLVPWTRDLASGSEFAESVAALEVEAFLCRFAMVAQPQGSAGRTPGRAAAGGPALVGAGSSVAGSDDAVRRAGDMAAYISDNFHRPLRVAQVAGVAHVHPHYATALFKRVFGLSIHAYLVRYRVGEAQRLLVTGDIPVSDVGRASGFPSHSTFYASFTAACGMPPASYRRIHAGAS